MPSPRLSPGANITTATYQPAELDTLYKCSRLLLARDVVALLRRIHELEKI